MGKCKRCGLKTVLSESDIQKNGGRGNLYEGYTAREQ